VIRKAILALVLVSIALFATPSARAVYASGCYYEVVDVLYTTMYMDIVDPQTGQITRQPIGTTVTYYYEWRCYSATGPTVYYPPPSPTPTQTFGAPAVTIDSLDTVSPSSPLVNVHIESAPGNPAATLDLRVNGSTRRSQVIPGSGAYSVAGVDLNDGSFTVVIVACAANGECGRNSFKVSRHTTSPVPADENMIVLWIDGDTAMRRDFGHSFRQSYTTMSATVPVIGDNARVQLLDGTTFLRRRNSDDEPAWGSQAVYRGTITNGGLSWGGYCWNTYNDCYDSCSALCTYSGAFGYSPYVEESIVNFRVTPYVPGRIVWGGHLTVYPQ